jgi:CarD family transcriptional regulator
MATPLRQGARTNPRAPAPITPMRIVLLIVLAYYKGPSRKQTREKSGLSLTEGALCDNLPISMGEINIMFKIGDRAVYPAQGVGVVEKIESREFCGQTHDFYILRIIDNDMTIMVPVGNARQVGLRTLISKDKVETIYNVLEEKQIGSLAIASWSRRQREYNDKIKTGDPKDVAEVLRELYLIKESKELSYGEKKVLELARRLLVKELALAEGIGEEMVTKRLDKMVN